MSHLTGKTIAVLLEQQYNEQEFWYPKTRLLEAGATVITAGPVANKEYLSKVGLPAKADAAFGELKADTLHGVIIPGGFAPDYMRRSKECLALVRTLHEQGKLVAFICHAGWVPISAGILKGRKVTSYPSIRDDMVNAGALWEDSAMVRDGNLISSRTPLDLPDFMRGVIEFLQG